MALTLADTLELVLEVGRLTREHPPSYLQRQTLLVLNELFRRTNMSATEYLAEVRKVLGVDA